MWTIIKDDTIYDSILTNYNYDTFKEHGAASKLQ